MDGIRRDAGATIPDQHPTVRSDLQSTRNDKNSTATEFRPEFSTASLLRSFRNFLGTRSIPAMRRSS